MTAIISEYEFLLSRPVDISKNKIEMDKLRRELNEAKKTHKLDLERIIRERDDMIKNYENLKNDDILKLEHAHKMTLEKMKNTVKTKEEECNEIMQENSLLKTQVEYLENSLNNYKNFTVDPK